MKVDIFYIPLFQKRTTINVPAKSRILSCLPAPMDSGNAILSMLIDLAQEKWVSRTFRVFKNSWDEFDGGCGNISSTDCDLQFVGTIHVGGECRIESIYIFEELESRTHFKIPGAGPIIKRRIPDEDDLCD